MLVPDEAVEIVKKYEGLHKVRSDGLVYPYVCPAGVWTIGYGSTREADGSRIHAGTPPKTVEECELLLIRDLDDCARKAVWLSPLLVKSDRRRSAIISFIYNLGWPNYRASTLRKRVLSEDWSGAAGQIKRWVFAAGRKLPGLVRRREEEAGLLL